MPRIKAYIPKTPHGRCSFTFFFPFALIVLAEAGFLSSFSVSVAFASRMRPDPRLQTEYDLENCHQLLTLFKKECGRYPLTSEGIEVIHQLPNKVCPAYGHSLYHNGRQVIGFGYLQDGWNQRFQYTSDGKTYRIEASHGYSLTNKTKAKAGRKHWDNPDPPPYLTPHESNDLLKNPKLTN